MATRHGASGMLLSYPNGIMSCAKAKKQVDRDGILVYRHTSSGSVNYGSMDKTATRLI